MRRANPEAMEQSTATRRLVKSPPELWAELSSPDTLGRHLAEFGEIRITRTTPETTVAWEGERASGTVELTPAGWGTKVMLTATPQAPPAQTPEPEPAARPAEPSPAAAAATPAAVTPAAATPATQRPAALTPAQPRPAAATPAEPPRGFFARLFRKPAASIPAPPAPTPDPAPPTPTPQPGPLPPAPDPAPPTPTPQPPAPPQIEVLDADRAAAILAGVLDDLGAAHHRPFSRD